MKVTKRIDRNLNDKTVVPIQIQERLLNELNQ